MANQIVVSGDKPFLKLVDGQDLRRMPSGGCNTVKQTVITGIETAFSETTSTTTSMTLLRDAAGEVGLEGIGKISTKMQMSVSHGVTSKVTHGNTLINKKSVETSLSFPHGQNTCYFQWCVLVGSLVIAMPDMPLVATTDAEEKQRLENTAEAILLTGTQKVRRFIKGVKSIALNKNDPRPQEYLERDTNKDFGGKYIHGPYLLL